MIRLISLLLINVILAGCGQQLYGDLKEHEVNDVVGALRSEGIDATKSASGDDQWAVKVPSADFARSIAILKNQNLPPQSFDGLGRVFKKDSLVSTETEERARLIYALSQELQRTLSQLDGVVLARVHPVILPKDSFSSRARVSSASVFIKHRPGADIASKIPIIRELVAHGIEDLDVSKVSVAAFATEARVIPKVVEKKDDRMFFAALSGGGGIGVLMLVGMTFALRRRRDSGSMQE